MREKKEKVSCIYLSRERRVSPLRGGAENIVLGLIKDIKHIIANGNSSELLALS